MLALILVVLFARLGFWQLDRHMQHVERNELIATRLAQPAVPIQQLLAEAAAVQRGEADEALAAADPTGIAEDVLAFRRVRASGRYQPERELLLRNRSYQGRPGWHVLTPFVLADGLDPAAAAVLVGAAGAVDRSESAREAKPGVGLIVDRGWVPQGHDEAPVAGAAPPEGIVEVEGVLVPEQDPPTGRLAGLVGRDPVEGALDRTFMVDVDRLARQLPYALAPAYLIPTEQVPPQQLDLPVSPGPPAAEPAPHLGYAVQWFAFALIGVVGYALLLRQRVREASRKR